ncbi:MAG: PaaI family thioesterase [Acidimicrobiia bacterium]|nr:PaaI family thioesterase [Acidimicrobiia bacterium]
MDRWLGDGGMPLLGELGLDLDRYGVGDGGLGWVEGTWVPTERACNPNGPVQGGVFGAVVDAAMTFATLASLDRGESGSLLDMNMQYLRGARHGQELHVRGEVTRLGRAVAFARAAVTDTEGRLIVEGTGTNMLRRQKTE